MRWIHARGFDMTRRHKILLIAAALFFATVGIAITIVGPWPTYKGGFEDKPYYRKALMEIERRRRRLSGGSSVGPFQAGWGSRSITPPPGTPLAGFGARKGKPSTGAHDEIFVKALAVSDGTDTAVIVAADMLIVPENVAEMVRGSVAERTSLTADDILFNASHNHSGPGAYAPGIASELFNGPYDPNIPAFLAEAFTEAIIEARQSLEPAKVAYGGVDAPEYIRNRTRKSAPVDSEISYMLIEQLDGDRCIVVSYSAHPTILSAENMQFSGEYPGFLVRHIAEQTGAEAIFLGGAVGSMSHRAPDRSDPFDRCRAMGVALADKVLEAAADTTLFEEKMDVASVGFAMQLPPFQLRLNENWRASKFLLPVLGIDTDGWMHAVRIGDIALVAVPADFCGEISVDLKSRLKNRLGDLWILSFNGDYVGYISPDKYYYDKDETGGYGYERGTMSWIGPDQEALTVSLIMQMIDALFRNRREMRICVATERTFW
jgi:hypothetical protein